MTKSLILRNEGTSSIVVDDLGIFVSATSSLNIDQLVNTNRFAVFASQDLKDKLISGELILNDGTSDISIGNINTYLERYCVLEHSLEIDHVGDLSENRITDGNILARVADDESITGVWNFPGGIILQSGIELPALIPAEGAVFYKTTVPKGLFVSDGTSWIELADTGDFDPITGHIHNGTDAPRVSHTDLINVTPDLHHAQNHTLDGANHTGNLSENRISNDSILARVADDETITGTYDFSGGSVIIETGAALPSGTIATGRLFWRDDGTANNRALFVGDGTGWVEFIKTSEFSSHNHDGIDAPKVDHIDLLNKGTKTHSEIDAHIVNTIDPHGDIMTVNDHINTPEIRGINGDINIDANSAGNTTIFLKNDGGGGLTVRIAGTLDVDGALNHTATTDLLIEDNKIILNSNYTLSSPNTDASLEVERGTVDNAIIKWEESSDKWLAGVGSNLKSFTFSDNNETISGDWNFEGSLVAPYGGTLPTSAPEGGLFWKTGATDNFYIGDGTTWQKLLLTSDFATHTHNGTNSAVVSHSDLSNVSENQHHSKIHSFNDIEHHSGSLSESKIADGSILARVASNETITGDWSFANGNIVIPSGTSLPPLLTEGGLFWLANTDTLYAADGTAWCPISKKDGVLSVSPGLAINNAGSAQDPIFDVKVDDTTIEIAGASGGLGGNLKVKAIAENLITNGSLLARVGDTETITGDWEFDGSLTLPTIPGTTPPVSYPNGQIVQLEGNDDLYIGTGTGVVKVITETNLNNTIKFCHTFTRRAADVPAGTFLKIGTVISNFNTGAVVVAPCKLTGVALIVRNSTAISDGSGIELVVNGSTAINISLNIPNGEKKAFVADLSATINAGDYIAVRCKTTNGTSFKNPVVNLYYK